MNRRKPLRGAFRENERERENGKHVLQKKKTDKGSRSPALKESPEQKYYQEANNIDNARKKGESVRLKKKERSDKPVAQAPCRQQAGRRKGRAFK